jgi:hypothetical protein
MLAGGDRGQGLPEVFQWRAELRLEAGTAAGREQLVMDAGLVVRGPSRSGSDTSSGE